MAEGPPASGFSALSGAAALKAEKRELRTAIAGLEREGSSRRSGDAPIRQLNRLAKVALPPGPGHPVPPGASLSTARADW
jgi:hypothetical protein